MTTNHPNQIASSAAIKTSNNFKELLIRGRFADAIDSDGVLKDALTAVATSILTSSQIRGRMTVAEEVELRHQLLGEFDSSLPRIYSAIFGLLESGVQSSEGQWQASELDILGIPLPGLRSLLDKATFLL